MLHYYFSREVLVLEYEDGTTEKMDYGPILEHFVSEEDFDSSAMSIDEYIESILSEKKYYYLNKEWITKSVVRYAIESRIKNIVKTIQNIYITQDRKDDLAA